MTATTWNPIVKTAYPRLLAEGKPKMSAFACMAKLLRIVYGVLKADKPFDPNHPDHPKLGT